MLNSIKEIEVRFNELDPLGVVWHGNYIKYFEDGREDFGLKYGIGYGELKSEEIVAPIISVKCDYKKFVRFGEKLIIETTYEDCAAAKIILNYSIYRKTDKELVAQGQTIQVFTDSNGQLMLIWPEFLIKWKQKWGLIN